MSYTSYLESSSRIEFCRKWRASPRLCMNSAVHELLNWCNVQRRPRISSWLPRWRSSHCIHTETHSNLYVETWMNQINIFFSLHFVPLKNMKDALSLASSFETPILDVPWLSCCFCCKQWGAHTRYRPPQRKAAWEFQKRWIMNEWTLGILWCSIATWKNFFVML